MTSMFNMRPGTIMQFDLKGHGGLIEGVISHVMRNGAASYLAVFSEWWYADKPEEKFTKCPVGCTQSINVTHDHKIIKPAPQDVKFKMGDLGIDADEYLVKRYKEILACGEIKRFGDWVKFSGEGCIWVDTIIFHYYLKDLLLSHIEPTETIDWEACFKKMRDLGIVLDRSNRDPWSFSGGAKVNIKRMKVFMKANLNRYKPSKKSARKQEAAIWNEVEERNFEADQEMEIQARRENQLSEMTSRLEGSYYSHDDADDHRGSVFAYDALNDDLQDDDSDDSSD